MQRWKNLLEIIKAWPYYASGVSRVLLELMSAIRTHTDIKEEADKPDGVFSYYRRMDKELNQLKYSYGEHAFLHHMQIILGSAPISIRMSFKDKLKFLFKYRNKKWVPMEF